MDIKNRTICDIATVTSDAHGLVLNASLSRTGIQNYTPDEIQFGPTDKAIVAVYRPPDEVFAADSITSIDGAPLTVEHPGESVTSDNWHQYAVGEVYNVVANKDKGTVDAKIRVRDAAAIKSIQEGKTKQISIGYSADLDKTPGIVDGVAYDAIAKTIRANHVALVDFGRCGAICSIADHKGLSDKHTEALNKISDMEKKEKRMGTLFDKGIRAVSFVQSVVGDTLNLDGCNCDSVLKKSGQALLALDASHPVRKGFERGLGGVELEKATDEQIIAAFDMARFAQEIVKDAVGDDLGKSFRDVGLYLGHGHSGKPDGKPEGRDIYISALNGQVAVNK